MAGSLYNADNVVVGLAHLFTAPWVPGGPLKAIVPDSQDLFDVDAYETAGWAVAGATNEGFKINAETSTTTVTIEEQSTPVGESIEGKNIGIEAALAEDTLTSMQMAWGGGVITSAAAAAGVPGTSKMNLSDELVYVTAILEMKNFLGLPRRIYVPKMSLTGSGETTFRRAADKRLYPIKLNSLCKPTDIQIVDITAAAL